MCHHDINIIVTSLCSLWPYAPLGAIRNGGDDDDNDCVRDV